MKILICLLGVITIHYSAFAAEKMNINDVSKILLKSGLNIADFSAPDIGTCDPEGEYGFTIATSKNIKYHGNNIPKGASFGSCFGKINSVIIDTPSPNNVIVFDGVPCLQAVYLKEDKLCNCQISKEFSFKGIKIPKEANVYIKEGTLFAYTYVNRSDKKDNNILAFTIDSKGKAKPFLGSRSSLSAHCE